MIKMSFRLNLIITSLLALSSIINALHGQTLGTSAKRYIRHSDKQVALGSSPEYYHVSRSSIVSAPTPSFDPSNAQQSALATSSSDDIISPQDTNSHVSIPPAPISPPRIQDTCSDTSSRMLVMCYYPDWADPAFPPEKIDFGRIDWIDFAFAFPNEHFALVWDDMDSGPKLLERLVTAAHAGGSKVKLSIGGWTGSQYAFSDTPFAYQAK